ncbi:MAG TPA: type II toxin-antitoxin system PemK/MazF family toxin [Thermoanaerobaculia bacterium]|jgi:mRNA-degrading endonuclease toxin of MazEF toxin-antitoxin module|nr:type II toxin-antitoxin system PemK/MazF family toxin [Thermoanaerobaculia bacterium]
MAPPIYRLGDVVQILYPFADYTSEKERPAAVVSSEDFCKRSGKIIAAAITGSTWLDGKAYGTIEILDLTNTDLTKPSIILALLHTVPIEKVLRRRGTLDKATRVNLIRQVKAFFPS